MRQIVFPQAMRLIVPSLGNSVNSLLKTTSITSVISMEELLRRTQELIQERFMVLELFVVAALYYLLMTTVWSFFQRKIEAYYGRGYAAHDAGRSGWRAWLAARRSPRAAARSH
jgi:polar amino acid transport system permease protein